MQGTVRAQIPRRGVDGVDRVVRVRWIGAAGWNRQRVRGERRRQHLHRALRPLGIRAGAHPWSVAQAVVRLDRADRGEDRPREPRAGRRGALVQIEQVDPNRGPSRRTRGRLRSGNDRGADDEPDELTVLGRRGERDRPLRSALVHAGELPASHRGHGDDRAERDEPLDPSDHRCWIAVHPAGQTSHAYGEGRTDGPGGGR